MPKSFVLASATMYSLFPYCLLLYSESLQSLLPLKFLVFVILVLITLGKDSANVSSWSKVAFNRLPEGSSVVKSSSMESRHQPILLQPNSSVIASDTYTTSSSSLVSTLEYVTASNSVVTSSIGGQFIPNITKAEGV